MSLVSENPIVTLAIYYTGLWLLAGLYGKKKK